jgi:transposase
MGLPLSPFSKEMHLMRKPNTTANSVDYFRLPRPLWRTLKKCLPKDRKSTKRGGRPRACDRAVIDAICYVLWTGCQWKAVHREWFGVSSSVIHERFQRWRRLGIFEKLMKKMVEHYARERGLGWEWQSMASKSCAAPLGGEKTGGNPTDRGKKGAKIHLMVDERGAPLSVVLSGANRHDKTAAMDLIVSVLVKRPLHKEQHLCADKAYDAEDVREFVALEGYEAHIKVDPRRRKGTRSEDETPGQKESLEEVHPARRWVVERTLSWLNKRRSLRTRWSKKAGNWQALVQLACAHVLLNLAVFG